MSLECFLCSSKVEQRRLILNAWLYIYIYIKLPEQREKGEPNYFFSLVTRKSVQNIGEINI